jgi:hypothetical protein
MYCEESNEINLMQMKNWFGMLKQSVSSKKFFDVNKILTWKDNILLLDESEDALPEINQFYGVNFVIKDAISNKHISRGFSRGSQLMNLYRIYFRCSITETVKQLQKRQNTMKN